MINRKMKWVTTSWIDKNMYVCMSVCCCSSSSSCCCCCCCCAAVTIKHTVWEYILNDNSEIHIHRPTPIHTQYQHYRLLSALTLPCFSPQCLHVTSLSHTVTSYTSDTDTSAFETSDPPAHCLCQVRWYFFLLEKWFASFSIMPVLSG